MIGKISSWNLYVIRCSNRSLYTGISTDVKRRFEEHNSNSAKSAKYLKGKGPLQLVYQKKLTTRSIATKCEIAFKKLSKKNKEFFLLNQSNIDKMFDKLIVESKSVT